MAFPCQAVVKLLMSLKDIHVQTGQLEPAEPMFGLETSWPLDENKGQDNENIGKLEGQEDKR